MTKIEILIGEKKKLENQMESLNFARNYAAQNFNTGKAHVQFQIDRLMRVLNEKWVQIVRRIKIS